MNYSPLVFLAAFFALATSWFGLVLTPQIQIGRDQPETNIVNRSELYPQERPGLARQGREIYRANGCAACHTEQVGQTGTACDVVLTDAGTNQADLVTALGKVASGKSNPDEFLSGLPKPVLKGVDVDTANMAFNALKAAGAKVEIRVVPLGPDIERGWGLRRTVAADYLYDYPVMLGSLRVGPDLANIGARQPDSNWQLRHLYAPQLEVKGSVMPPYRYLFKEQKILWQRSPDALDLPGKLAPPPGYEIVPRPEAKALVAYLLSLNSSTVLFETPMAAPPAPPTATATNAPAK